MLTKNFDDKIFKITSFWFLDIIIAKVPITGINVLMLGPFNSLFKKKKGIRYENYTNFW